MILIDNNFKIIREAVRSECSSYRVNSVADTGFLWGGGANSPGGRRQHTILPKFPKKTAWNWNKLDRGDRRASKILLCRSATGIGLFARTFDILIL